MKVTASSPRRASTGVRVRPMRGSMAEWRIRRVKLRARFGRVTGAVRVLLVYIPGRLDSRAGVISNRELHTRRGEERS